MSSVFVQFTDENETAICAIFGSMQDPAHYNYLGQVDDTDVRYVKFISPIEAAAAPAENTPPSQS